MSRAIRILSFLLLIVLPAWSRPQQFRTVSVPVTDASAAGSPLSISGWVSFQVKISSSTVSARQSLQLSLVNVSKKPILAYALRLHLTSGYVPAVSATYIADDFFKSKLIPPGARFSIRMNPPQTEHVPSSALAAPSPPKATASVAYVEFGDGTKFGGGDSEAALRRERNAAISSLQILLAAYQSGGSDAFRDALARQSASSANAPNLGSLLQRLARTAKSRGAPAAVAQIRADLALASKRLAAAPDPSPDPLKICTLQLWNSFGVRRDWDAPRLARELSARKLSSGRPILGMYLGKEKNRKLQQAEIRREGCDYVVEVWPHDATSPASFGMYGATGLAPQNPVPAPPQWAIGHDSLNFRILRPGSEKPIASGTATFSPAPTPSPSWRGLTPYQIIANDILARLNAAH